MHLLGRVSQITIELCWQRQVAGAALVKASQLRGALAQAFAEQDLFHQHDPEGNFLYRYPTIQYRWRNDHGVITGWGDAVSQLLHLPWLDLVLTLGEEEVQVIDVILTTSHSLFGISERLLHYQFFSPALILNQKNYSRYQAMNPLEQQNERDRLLVAQILTALRGLEIDFPVQLYAAFTQLHTQSCFYKKQKLLGLAGSFVCNAVLPSGFAIGHAVSHGYGWIVPQDEA
jgi:hypothetical protein